MPQAKYAITQTTMGGKAIWTVPSRQHPLTSGLGDTIHHSLKDAESEREWNLKLDKQDGQRRISEAQRVENERAVQDKTNDLDGYELTLNPLQRGRAVAALNRTLRFNGELLTRKEYVKRAIENGSIVCERMGEMAIQHYDNSYMPQSSIGKTAMAYALFLCKK